MNEARYRRAVEGLRRLVRGHEAEGGCDGGRAAGELVHLAAEVAFAFEGGEGMEVLRERTERYKAELSTANDTFRRMGNLTAYFLEACWRADETVPCPFSEVEPRGSLLEPGCDAEWAEGELEEFDRLLGQDHGHDPARYARVLGLEADQAGRPLEPWSMACEFGNLYVEFRRGFLVCRDLPRLVVRLERAAAFLEDGGVLRRLAGYFFGLLTWADANHLRGSREILACHSTCKSGRFTSFAGCVHWISRHLRDKMAAVLRAAESLECYLGVPAEGEPGPGLGPRERPSAPPLDAGADDDEDDPWHSMDERPPDGYRPLCLQGDQWQIAWALGDEKMLGGHTPKLLRGKLRRGVLWGRGGRGHYEVYADESTYPEEKVLAASRRLDEIKARGPWHHRTHQLPRNFAKHRDRPLCHEDPSVLAGVVHEARVAAGKRSVPEGGLAALHEAMSEGGVFFGVYDGGRYVLYLHDGVPGEAADRAHLLLRERAGRPDVPRQPATASDRP